MGTRISAGGPPAPPEFGSAVTPRPTSLLFSLFTVNFPPPLSFFFHFPLASRPRPRYTRDMKKPTPTLIVAGLGHLPEICSAAALALRRFPHADVAFASKAALPDVLEARAPAAPGAVHLLGVGLTGDPPRLEAVLRALHTRRVAIAWHSVVFPLPDSLPPAFASLLDVHFDPSTDSLRDAVARTLALPPAEAGLPCDDSSPDARAWADRFSAASWSFSNTRDPDVLETLVRDLAAALPPSRWSPSTRRLLDAHARYGARVLLGDSPASKALRRDIRRVAASSAPRVLVTGENGTGKETVALQLHLQSGRRGPFLAFNCATTARDLLESRLFGYRKGAFTGAAEDRPGLFRDADGGTVFLDEIAELPLETQGLLLRVLQESRVQPVGGTAEYPVDVRIVAATHRDLPALVREGRFRADLYFRLALVELRLSPLRERPDDIPPIARAYWKTAAPKRKPLSADDLAALAAHDWPGNVRELQNVLERAALFPDRALPDLVAEEASRAAALRDPAALPPPTAKLSDVVRAHVRRVLALHDGNIAAAARTLGVSRATVRAHST